MNDKDKRLGFVGVIIDNREVSAPFVNAILHDFSSCILARTGLPNAKDTASVITLVVDISTDQLGVLTGKLGAIPGVSVKSGLAKK
jgi:putative iron-only hydrogenase system regulator